MALWKLHGDGKNVAASEIVLPEERLTWPRTIGFGSQHVVAMFGATFLVPLITGFPPSTTLLFSGIGTLLFLIITQNQLPSYLGSSFAFIAPISAAVASDGKTSPSAASSSSARCSPSSASSCTSPEPAGSTRSMPPVVARRDRRPHRLQPRAGGRRQLRGVAGHRGHHAARRSSSSRCSSSGFLGRLSIVLGVRRRLRRRRALRRSRLRATSARPPGSACPSSSPRRFDFDALRRST